MDNTDDSKFRNLFMFSFTSWALFRQIIMAGKMFLVSYAIYLGASETQIGIMGSIPLLANVVQIFAVYLYQHYQSRKKVVLALSIARYFFFYGMIFIPLLVDGGLRVTLLLVLYAFGFFMNSFIQNGLLEWNNVYVPTEIRGSYFSTRNIISNAVYIMSSIILGKLLDKFGGNYFIYVSIFAFMLIFVTIEIISIVKIKDFTGGISEKPKVNLIRLIKIPLKNKRYMGYVYFTMWWRFSQQLAAPYFTIYAVRYLNLTYSYIAIVTSVVSFIKLFMAKPWGGLGDKKGWKNIMVIAGLGGSLSGILWFFTGPSTSFLYPMVILVQGIFFMGMNIVIFNLNIALSDPENRLIYFGFNTLMLGLFSFFAPYITAFFVGLFKNYNMSIGFIEITGYQIMFLIAGIIKLLDTVYGYRLIKEVESGNIHSEQHLKKS